MEMRLVIFGLFALLHHAFGQIVATQSGMYILYPLDSRLDIASQYLASTPSMKVGAELGVLKADFLVHTLDNWPQFTKYYAVDAWTHQENYVDSVNFAQETHNLIYKEALEKMARWKDKIVVLKNWTSEARHAVPDGSLDYLYVDARHDYCGVMQDLVQWWPKVKVGGLICGHDYVFAIEVQDQDWSLCGDGTINPGAVRGAANDFMTKHNIQFIPTMKETLPSFCGIKQPAQHHGVARQQRKVLD
jgi:hypothetical protein